MSNLEIFEKLREVPEIAKKKITGGRLSGMTDIKPMWRIEKLTEVFGPVGIGWKTKTINKTIIDGANDEKIATVDIELYVKYDGENWSEPIEGSGGSSFISKEQKGLYTSDECFKMAYTDALSVACRSLGMGADVYWGDSKYDTNKKEPTKKDAEEYVVGFGKHKGEKLIEVIKDDWYKNYLLNGDDEYIKKCIVLLTNEKPLTEEEQNIRLDLIEEIQGLSILYEIDLEEVKTKFKVESLTDMTTEQMKKCIVAMKKKGE